MQEEVHVARKPDREASGGREGEPGRMDLEGAAAGAADHCLGALGGRALVALELAPDPGLGKAGLNVQLQVDIVLCP